MANGMLHCNEIARAIRLICQGAAALTEDLTESQSVRVGSNMLFEPGQQVRLRDADGEEEATVAQRVGLTQVVLTAPVEGEYLLSRGARIERAAGGMSEVQWVGHGSPELMPRSPAERYPCVLVKPEKMRQPLGEGSNRTTQQDYSFAVYYVERYREGHEANAEVLERAGELMELLMSDIYLGGTCWHSQVTEVEPEPAVQQRLRDVERPLRVVELTMLARRAVVV